MNKNVVYAICCVFVVMSDVETDTMCCEVRCGGVMQCGIWCGVKYAMLIVGVVWNSCVCRMVRDVDCGCVMWNMCFEMCLEYGGPR